MIELESIAGSTVSSSIALTELPIILGRSPNADFHVESPGVWDRHATLELDEERGFLVRSFSGALTSVNGVRLDEATLKNGDLIELGGAKLRFWLKAAPQARFLALEIALWAGLGLICLGQIALIYFLPR